jgi:hypothetical protein
VSKIEENYRLFKLAASRFNNNSTYWYPIQYHAEIPVVIPEKCRVEHHAQHPTVHHYQCHFSNQSDPNNNNMPRGYEHHYAFKVTTVCPDSEAPGDDDESMHPPRVPVQTPANVKGFFAMDTEEEFYKENKN